MTKRERTISIVVGAAVGIWALDQIIITPQMNARADLVKQKQAAMTDLNTARGLITNRPALERRWAENKAKGLLSDAGPAIDQLANHLNAWANEQRLGIGALSANNTPQPVNKPGGKVGEKEPGFMKVSMTFTVTGTMSQMANFVSRIQNAEIPIRISEMRINTKAEGLDNQELFLNVSTIILKSDQARPETAGAGGSTSRPAPTSRGVSTSGPATLREARQ